MRSPSGLQACGHLALARGQGAPFCHRRCSMCSRAGTDAAVPTSSATSAPLAELAAPCSRPGHCQGVLAPRAAHARGRGGSTKRRRLLQACPTRYTGTRVKVVVQGWTSSPKAMAGSARDPSAGRAWPPRPPEAPH